MDSNSILSHAFDKLKAECGKDPSFSYPDMQIRNEVQSLTASLKAQVAELEQQVAVLESENMKVVFLSLKILTFQIISLFLK